MGDSWLLAAGEAQPERQIAVMQVGSWYYCSAEIGMRNCHPAFRHICVTITITFSSCAGSIEAPPPFHLAFPVHDLAAAREFYGGSVPAHLSGAQTPK